MDSGPLKYGYETDYWTLQRIADVIYREFKVTYHRCSLSRIMEPLGYSCQKPGRKASERDEDSRQQWLNEIWEKDKKK